MSAGAEHPTPRLADGTRVRVVAGNPTAEELAAVIAALEVATPPSRPGRPSRAAWAEAARREATRGGRIATPADLAQPLR